jgi:hypothetical protein
MEVFILVLLVILASMAGLAVGVIARRAPLKGSCGGLACTCSGERAVGLCPEEARPR